jgi:hypothetical protein
MVFRDHFLSDLVGFVYSRMGAAEAAADLLHRVRENCRGILSGGRDALVPVILDGENAWEYYESNGRPFLRELYRLISSDPEIEALTLTEALGRMEPAPLTHIFPGSWINANFDIWIGAQEDTQAWEHLLRARQTYERITAAPEGRALSEEARNLALEELLIAEGSDWCWWYGPEHDSDNRPEFDKLYRGHLGNVYRALGLAPPEELSRSILAATGHDFHTPPSAQIRPTLDGDVTSFFEWLGAGVYRVDGRSGSMHGGTALIRELYYGCDGANLFLRVDFEPGVEETLPGTEVLINVNSASVKIRLEAGQAVVADPAGAEAFFSKVLEVRLPLEAPGQPAKVQISLWRDGLPMDALPMHGWLECRIVEPREWGR